jgi:ankyrin repeat protein
MIENNDKPFFYTSNYYDVEFDLIKLAIQDNNLDEFKKILGESFIDLDRNCADYTEGNTLVLACENGSYDIAKELVDLGVTLQPQALLSAVSFNHPKLVGYLLSKGIKPNHNCISYANDKNLIEILLAAGAPINPEKNDDYSALLDAIYEEDIDLLEFLLKKGMNPNLPLSRPPLVAACYFSEQAQQPLRVIKLLLDYGADKNTKDEGKTLFKLIEENESIRNKEEILELFRD